MTQSPCRFYNVVTIRLLPPLTPLFDVKIFDIIIHLFDSEAYDCFHFRYSPIF
jgi:hypothetical protein